jgi:pseudouridine-5'-phosphate glycosidase
VVALETALLSFGLPHPANLDVFHEMAAAVEDSGAIPAGIALYRGSVRIGLDDRVLAFLSRAPGAERGPARMIHKCARRDIGWVLAGGHSGATTVSSTLWLAHRAGIGVFATGGIGGVHPAGHGPPDVSADLATMSVVPMILVSTGVKSICDPVATAELLEALSVPVVGYGVDRFPHFYSGESAAMIPAVAGAAAAARAFLAYRAHGGTATLLVANPAPAAHRLEPALLERLTAAGMRAAARSGVAGNALTPFLLDYLARKTGGRTVTANRALLVANARLAGAIAVEMSAISRRSRAR